MTSPGSTCLVPDAAKSSHLARRLLTGSRHFPAGGRLKRTFSLRSPCSLVPSSTDFKKRIGYEYDGSGDDWQSQCLRHGIMCDSQPAGRRRCVREADADSADIDRGLKILAHPTISTTCPGPALSLYVQPRYSMQWFYYPIAWNSARDPAPDGYDYAAMTPEELRLLTAPFLYVRSLAAMARRVHALILYQWYRNDYYYAHTTIGVITVAILIAGLFNIIFHHRLRKPAKTYVTVHQETSRC
jgi:hypothetical protein